MAFSSWLCSNNTKNMLVKIVYPGGRVELHDRPVLAAEIILRNPRCIVAHPHVFQKPWAIVAPETMLMPGQKFYVVPISTIRKLQRLSFKYSPSPLQDFQSSKTFKDEEKDDNKASSCWMFFMNKSTLIPYSCLKHTDNEGEEANTNSNNRKNTAKNMERDGCFSDNTCFLCLLTGIKIKGEETRTSSSSGSSETKGLIRKRTRYLTSGSPKRYSSIDHWQPNLESIIEEKSN